MQVKEFLGRAQRVEGKGWVQLRKKMNVLILQPNILVTNMASCGWFAREGYANASMQRGVELPYARGKLFEEQNKGCGGGRGGGGRGCRGKLRKK